MAKRDIERFIERLSSMMAGDTILMKYREGYLRVEVYGSEILARRTKEGIKRVLEEFKAKRLVKTIRVSAKTLQREAGVAIPLDVLETILKLKGYDVETIDDEFETSAPLDDILEYAKILRECLEEAANLYATRTAKKTILAICTLKGRTPMEIIDKGLETGIIEEDDEGKLFIPGDWREAVKKLAHLLGGGGFDGIAENSG